MGSGNLARELRHLAELLGLRIERRQTLQAHLHVLAELIHGLGSRSTRHVMNRATCSRSRCCSHVGDGYRRRYQERIHPPDANEHCRGLRDEMRMRDEG